MRLRSFRMTASMRHFANMLLLMVTTALLVACASKPVNVPKPKPVEPPKPLVTPVITQQYESALKLMQDGQFDQAQTLFETLSKSAPKLSGPWVNLGIIAEHQGNTDEAFGDYQKALSIKPHNAIALNQMALIRQRQGKFSEALQYYKRGLNSQPDNPDLNYNIAILYELYLQDYKKAVEHYQNYIDVISSGDKTIENRIKILKRKHEL